MIEQTTPALKRSRKMAREPKADTTVPEVLADAPERVGTGEAATVAVAAKRESKTAKVIALLQRGEGATITELVAATGWLPHTTRAALTGLRKKRHAIAKDKRDGVTCYRIGGTA